MFAQSNLHNIINTYFMKNGRNGPTSLMTNDGNISANNIAPVDIKLHILPAPPCVTWLPVD